MGAARDGQEHFPSEGFEQGDRSWEQLVTRALLKRDIFWTHAQGVARCTLASTLQSGPHGCWQRKAQGGVDKLQHVRVASRFRREKIHRGTTNEARHKLVRGLMIQRMRISELLQPPLAQH
jgi:hypothetical protein